MFAFVSQTSSLNQRRLVSPTDIGSDIDRSSSVSEFGSAATLSHVTARGRALRRVSENSAWACHEFNQHLGCCSTSVAGGVALMPARTLILRLQLQLNKLNTEMVKAFPVSVEYRGRF